MRDWFILSNARDDRRVGQISRPLLWWVVFCVTLSTVVLVAQLFGWIG